MNRQRRLQLKNQEFRSWLASYAGADVEKIYFALVHLEGEAPFVNREARKEIRYKKEALEHIILERPYDERYKAYLKIEIDCPDLATRFGDMYLEAKKKTGSA